MSCTLQDRVVNEETEMKKTFLAKKRGKLKWKPQDLSWDGNILTCCSLSTCFLCFTSLGSPVKAKVFKEGTVLMTGMSEAATSPESFPFLPCIYPLLATTGEGCQGQGYITITRKKNVEANFCLDSIPFRAGVTQTKLNIASDLLTY